jgi:hypothetical protein
MHTVSWCLLKVSTFQGNQVTVSGIANLLYKQQGQKKKKIRGTREIAGNRSQQLCKIRSGLKKLQSEWS